MTKPAAKKPAAKKAVKKPVKRPVAQKKKPVGTKVATKAKKRSKAPKSKKVVCKCPLHHPFRWAENPQPSIFADDPAFRSRASEISTANVEKQRAEGKLVGTIKGISRSREEEVLRVRNFSVFSLAAPK